MNFPRLEISQRPSRISLKQTKAEMEIKSGKSYIEIKQNTGDLKIDKDIVEINIDNYPSEYDLGYRNVADFTKDIKNEGAQTALKAIANYAKTGDKLMDFKNNQISDLVKSETTPSKKDISIKYKRGPDIKVNPHHLKMKYKPQFPVINSQLIPSHVNAEWGQVKVQLDQKHKTNIKVMGNYINRTV